MILLLNQPVIALFDNCAFVTFAKAPPNVSAGLTVSPSEVNVIPFSLPVAVTVCTVPEPNPEAADTNTTC